MPNVHRRRSSKALKFAAMSAAALWLVLPAAQATGLRLDGGARVTDVFPLSLAGQSLDEASVDWRTPQRTFEVVLPPSDWVESLKLTLYADPLGPSRDMAQLLDVRLNDGEPTTLNVERQGFTARLDLPLEDVRPGRNRLDVRLRSQSGTCLTFDDGGWVFDLNRSRVDTILEAKSRSVFLSEVRAVLERPTTTPRKISIRALGSDALTHEALIAQGVALRTPEMPRIKLGGKADIQIIAGTRLALAGTVTDEAIVEGQGARVAVHEGRPIRIILTGDTDAQVRRAVDAFATHHLPDARRRIATPAGLEFAGPLDADRGRLDRRTRISELGGLDFSPNWGAGVDEVRFDVADPQAAKARVLLDIERADFVAPDSRIDVSLNGRDLGQARLDSERVRLDYVVPQGWLQGQGNRLRVQPDLIPADEGCAPAIDVPGLRVRAKSRIDMRVPAPTGSNDLSRLAAGAGLLSDRAGEDTHVVLPESRAAREAALRIVARMAVAEGRGLVRASYGFEPLEDRDLVVFGRLPETIDAPRSVDLALANPGRGAVAGLFPDGDRWVGVFAPERGASLATAANLLSGEGWHDLAGGISRIDGERTEMVQMAYAGPDRRGFAVAALPGVPSAETLRIDSLPIAEFRLSDLRMAELPVPTFDLPEIADEIEAEFGASVSELSSSWSRIDFHRMNPLTDMVRRDAVLRGRYAAPRARAPELALRGAHQPLTAGVDFTQIGSADLRDLERSINRKSREVRRSLGLKAFKPDVSWSWADRHMSVPGLILFLVFGWACLLLSTASNRIRQ